MTYELNDIAKVVQNIRNAATSKTICFYGPMGAGKTTLIKHLVSHLGGIDGAKSPTFGIVNEYHSSTGELLAYHFDFYRLEDETEVLDLGFEEYLNQNVWIFIEWPDKIKTFLPKDVFNLYIEIKDLTTRKISF